MYLTLVSADTGGILYRRNLTTEGSEATCRVYTNASPTPLLPGWPAPSTAQPSLVERGLVTWTAMDDTASPNGWIADGDNETRGNNVDAHLDRNDDNLADLPRPAGNPSRVFDFPLDLTTAPANYGEAATVQLFYWDNWMHDALYQLGLHRGGGQFPDRQLRSRRPGQRRRAGGRPGWPWLERQPPRQQRQHVHTAGWLRAADANVCV